MKLFLLLTCILSSAVLTAQNNLIVFTQDSKPFYVVVNGIRQNMEAETNVKIDDLPGDFYKVKVVFADEKTPDVDKSVSFMEKNHEYSLEVIEKRGKYKIRYAGARPISESTNTGSSVAYHDQEIEQSTKTRNETSAESQTQTSVSSSSTSQSSSVNSSLETNTAENGSVNVNIEMSEGGVSMQVDAPKGNVDSGTASSEINSETQVSNNQTSNSISYQFIATGTMCSSPNVTNKAFIDFKYTLENANMFKRQELILAYFKTHCMLSEQVAGLIQLDYSTVDGKKIAKEGYRYTYDTENYAVVINALDSQTDKEEVTMFIGAGSTSSSSSSSQGSIENSSSSSSASNSESNTQYSKIPSYSGYVNCNTSLISDISDIYSSASSESFADDQLKTIQLATKGHCLSVEQVAKLSEMFSHESDQMTLFKWAFDKTYDIDNFYKLSSGLTFSSSKDEFNEFIDEQPTSHFTYVYSTTNESGMLIDDQDLKKRMEKESFGDDQLALAKQALVSRYISVEQIKNIMSIFSHESDVLEFLKMAYPRTTNQDQFYTLRTSLTFSSSKEEFDKIIE